jgi:hypothetical protein
MNMDDFIINLMLRWIRERRGRSFLTYHSRIIHDVLGPLQIGG